MSTVEAASSGAASDESLLLDIVLTSVFEAMLKQPELDNDDDPDKVTGTQNSQVIDFIASSMASTITGVGL